MTINLARPKIGHFVPVKSINIVKLIILHKYFTKNWLFSGLKKPAGLPGFEDRASGGPGLRKIGRAGGFYRPGPWLVTSLPPLVLRTLNTTTSKSKYMYNPKPAQQLYYIV